MLRRLFGLSCQKKSRPSSKYFRPSLEALEDRWVPDTVDWKPTIGNNWSQPQNWFVRPGVNRVPLATDSARFGHYGNQPVTVDINASVYGVGFGDGTNSYTGTMTLNNNIVLDAVAGFTLNQNPVAYSNISFGTGSKLEAEGGNSIFTNFHFTGARGTVWMKGPSHFWPQGATLTVSSNAASDTTADFLIGGSLTLANTSPVTFKGGAGITVAAGNPANGSMNIATTNNTVLSDNNDGGIIENWGLVTYNGGANIVTEVDMALLNHNGFSFSAAPGAMAES